MTALGNFGIDTQNDRGDMLVGFAERNNLKVTNNSSNVRQVRSGHGRA